MVSIEELASFCKTKGIVFQAATIYGGLAGFFDYGPLGVELKQNLKQSYWNYFVQKRQDIVGQDGSIITNPKVWKASGHIDNFADLILTTKESKTKIRADHFIEDELKIPADGISAQEINELITKHNLKYKGEDFEEVKNFNLMFQTQVGADTTKNSTAYLRPETCQSIFPNFRLVAEISRSKLPFGIVQIGKAFRNEISPRDFIFRCREFEQIEMEYFFNPNAEFEMPDTILNQSFQFLSAQAQDEKSNEMTTITISELINQKKVTDIHAYWLALFLDWLKNTIGLSAQNLRVREHVKTELSHYSSATVDIDYKFPFGFNEMLGIANRGNFDLTQHQELSKQKLEFFDEVTQEKIMPHVIEPSLGVERFIMAVLCEAYTDDKERGNIVLSLEPKIAPYSVAILPLMKKNGLAQIAKKVVSELQEEDIHTFYDESGSIGRRYARQDEIGTPYCVTIDFDTKEDNTVTIRDRDSTEQKRVSTKELPSIIHSLIRKKTLFTDI